LLQTSSPQLDFSTLSLDTSTNTPRPSNLGLETSTDSPKLTQHTFEHFSPPKGQFLYSSLFYPFTCEQDRVANNWASALVNGIYNKISFFMKVVATVTNGHSRLVCKPTGVILACARFGPVPFFSFFGLSLPVPVSTGTRFSAALAFLWKYNFDLVILLCVYSTRVFRTLLFQRSPFSKTVALDCCRPSHPGTRRRSGKSHRFSKDIGKITKREDGNGVFTRLDV
jgi:hypothetical protein